MRTPQDLPHPRATALRTGRGKWWIIAGVVVLVVLLASLKSLATLYTDSLWFSSISTAAVPLHRVWSTLLAVKVGLFASFGAIFFVLVWANLAICDRLAQRSPSPDPEDELVRRYQRAVRPYTGRVHAGVALVLALIAASGTVGEWNNWILFTHATSFGVKDPQFGMDVGFFVFRLPFLEFLVDWTLVALVVTVAVTVVFHYLNGGIRLQRTPPRVRPSVKAHLSVLLAMIALVKAGGYVLQRFQLDMSTNGYVEGAGYTDVHARLPALEVLLFISLFAAAILLYNIRRRGWTLPVLAVGLWAFVALVIGVIYPAVLQALTVNPAQSHLELPYIKRNIAATRAAYGLQHVQTSTFAGNTAKGTTAVPTSTLGASVNSLQNIRLWDPDPSITQRTFQKKQNIKSYYAFQSIGVDRYTIDGTMRPAVVGVRQINPTDLPSSGWVNAHLQYTHGEGVVLAAANAATPDGNPTFGISGVPVQSAQYYPKVSVPQVYFGLNQPGYVVADTHQPELTYQKGNTDVEAHYHGSGGVPMSSWLTRAAFAVRLGTFNLLVSNLITPQSKMMFVRTVVARAQKAAPFLSFDSDPYAAVVNGHIDWILDAYTTTANYPYSQNAGTEHVPPGSGLPSSYNYVRNSVKVVIDAYSGKMTFYAMDNDPILRAYEAAFPGMFTPATDMSPALRKHLRYPENMFSVQAAVYGRYHITSPSQFYNAGNAWTLSQTTGAGSPQNTLQVTYTTNAQDQIIGGSYQPMSPIYQVLQEPGSMGQSFTITDAYVPAGESSQILSAFIMGDANPGRDYERLRVYTTAPGSSVNGPVLADANIQQTSTVSKTITLLNQHGSQVLLGNVLMVPIGETGMLYVRPLYVQSSGNPQPQLKRVIAVYGQTVAMKPTLAQAVNAVFGTNLLSTTATSGSTPSATPAGTGPSANAIAQATKDIKEANAEFQKAQTDLAQHDLGAYQTDMNAGIQLTQDAQKLLGQAPSGSAGSSTASGATSASAGSTASRSTSTSTPTGTAAGSGHRSSGTGSGSSGGSSKTASTASGSGGKVGASTSSPGTGSSTTSPAGAGRSGSTITTTPGEA